MGTFLVLTLFYIKIYKTLLSPGLRVIRSLAKIITPVAPFRTVCSSISGSTSEFFRVLLTFPSLYIIISYPPTKSQVRFFRCEVGFLGVYSGFP